MSRDHNIYRIPYVGLKEGLHTFDFKITEKFFETVDIEEVEKADIAVDIEFNKKSSHFELKFNIQGYLLTACDRCLEQYPQELLDEYKIFVKLTDQENEESEDPDVVFINRQETHLDLKQLIYEFIELSIPLQRVCPNPGKTKYCNPDMLKYINKHKDKGSEEQNENDDIDPRWSALKKIKK
ncbi:MAG: DUF177 domain-containing protein [Chitinophagales bacterium]